MSEQTVVSAARMPLAYATRLHLHWLHSAAVGAGGRSLLMLGGYSNNFYTLGIHSDRRLRRVICFGLRLLPGLTPG